MIRTTAQKAAGRRAPGTVLSIVGGALVGVVAFFVVSFISLWSIRGGEAMSPIVLFALGAAMLLLLVRTRRSFQLAFLVAMVVLLVIGYLSGLDGRVANALAFDPGELLLYGGRSASVALVTGAIVGVVLVRTGRMGRGDLAHTRLDDS